MLQEGGEASDDSMESLPSNGNTDSEGAEDVTLGSEDTPSSSGDSPSHKKGGTPSSGSSSPRSWGSGNADYLRQEMLPEEVERNLHQFKVEVEVHEPPRGLEGAKFTLLPPQLLRRKERSPSPTRPGFDEIERIKEGRRARSEERRRGGAGGTRTDDDDDDFRSSGPRRRPQGSIRRAKDALEESKKAMSKEGKGGAKKKGGGSKGPAPKSPGKKDPSKSPSASSRRALLPSGGGGKEDESAQAGGKAKDGKKRVHFASEEAGPSSRANPGRSAKTERNFVKLLTKAEEEKLILAIRRFDVYTDEETTNESVHRLMTTVRGFCGFQGKTAQQREPGHPIRKKPARKLKKILETLHNKNLIPRPLADNEA